MSAGADGCPARVVEKGIPLPDCTRASRGRMSAGADGCPARVVEKGIPLPDCTRASRGRMMRLIFRKMSAICATCLLMGITWMTAPLSAQSAEESGIPQPSSAKVYSSMSDDSDIIANLIVGNVFEVVGAENDRDGGIWYRVRTDFGAEGYVKSWELDRLILDAQAMMTASAAAERSEDNAAEDPELEAEPEGGPDEDGPAGDMSDAGSDVGQEAEPEGGPGEEQPDGALIPMDNEPDMDNEIMSEGSSAEQVVDSQTESAFIDGAGFGKVTEEPTTEDESANNEGFTVIERTDKTQLHGHGRIDVMLIMMIAGGIVCIMAIAALARKMWICIRTET